MRAMREVISSSICAQSRVYLLVLLNIGSALGPMSLGAQIIQPWLMHDSAT